MRGKQAKRLRKLANTLAGSIKDRPKDGLKEHHHFVKLRGKTVERLTLYRGKTDPRAIYRNLKKAWVRRGEPYGGTD